MRSKILDIVYILLDEIIFKLLFAVSFGDLYIYMYIRTVFVGMVMSRGEGMVTS